MTVGAYIVEAQNEREKLFYVPIATETFFHNTWAPLINSLELPLLSDFGTGVDIEHKNLRDVLSELERLEAFASEYLEKGKYTHLKERATLLRERLPEAFTRTDAVVYIG